MVDECPEVIAFDDLRIETSKFITRESFELVVGELVKMGEVSIGYSRDGERVLKFKVSSLPLFYHFII